MTTTGPGVLGGLLLMVLGAFFLVWAFLASIVSLFTWESEPRVRREQRVVERRYSVVPAEESVLPADAEAVSEEQEQFWSRPSTRTHI
jgi:hypothetical protein